MNLEDCLDDWIIECIVDEIESEVPSHTDEFEAETSIDAENHDNDNSTSSVTQQLECTAIDSTLPADKDEEKSIHKMFGDDSEPIKKCCPKKCNQNIPKEIALDYRRSIQELGQEGQEFVIMGALESQRRVTELAQSYENVRKRKRAVCKDRNHPLKRFDLNYFFRGVNICRDMFLFLHGIGLGQFRNVLDHLKNKGITPREHGLKNKKSLRKNVLQITDREHVVNFIEQVGKNHGFPLPGRSKNRGRTMLPTSYTRSFVYREYCNSLGNGERKIHRTTFSKIWQQFCPHIAAAKPSSDLCNKMRS